MTQLVGSRKTTYWRKDSVVFMEELLTWLIR